MINIELGICDIKNSKSLLEKHIEESDDLSIKAYINFNIYKYTNDNKAKTSSIKDYETLYKNTKKFEYKYYLNQLR